MATTEPATFRLELVDPKDVRVHPDNVRKTLNDIEGLAASIAENGVLQPAIVVPVEGRYFQVVAGHRRRAAAEKAGVLLPVIVRPDLAGLDLPQIAAMLGENEARDDLSTADRARAFQRALDLGMTSESLARSSGRPEAEVAALLAVAAAPKATGLAERHDLTLDEASVFAEFEGDKDALKMLTKTAVQEPEKWDHRVAQIRRARDDAATIAAKRAELEPSGVRILTDEEGRDFKAARQRIEWIRTTKNGNLTSAAHKKCPGRSVYVHCDFDGKVLVDEFCEDPAGNGHIGRSGSARAGGAEKTEKQKETESKERRRVIANNRAMDTANGVRRTFVRKMLRRRTAPKGAERFVGSRLLTPYQQTNPPATALLDLLDVEGTGKLKPTAVAEWFGSLPESRVSWSLVLFVAAAVESTIRKTAWRSSDPLFAQYLRFLESNGYGLSDVETETVAMIEKAKKR